jgi:sensor histidine kinase YesM
LVENAFKHGDLKNESLEIKIDASEDSLTIFIKNKKKSAVIDKSTGLGLNNLERRLGLLLKDKFVLETKEENGFFISLLTIKN